MAKYKRVLLKLSGEQLSGDQESGIDLKFLEENLVQEVKQIVDAGVQLVLVPGAGNYIRGATFAAHGVERATGDYMGMMAGIINGLALQDLLNANGVKAKLMSTLKAEQACDPYVIRNALKELDNGSVLIVSGGTGRPFYTHDTAGVERALELKCDVMLKATKQDGVYDKDPAKHDDAELFETLDYQKAVQDPNIMVMDKAAMGHAMEQQMPLIVLNSSVEGNIAKAATGQKVGTIIS